MDTNIVSISSGFFRTVLIGTHEHTPTYCHYSDLMVYQQYRQIILIYT